MSPNRENIDTFFRPVAVIDMWLPALDPIGPSTTWPCRLHADGEMAASSRPAFAPWWLAEPRPFWQTRRDGIKRGIVEVVG
jgi:hypothetical protein